MKIMHLCLACFYVDGFDYQENILVRHHRDMGHEVMVLASTEMLGNDGGLYYKQSGSYILDDGIPITRLDYSFQFPQRVARKLRKYTGIEEHIKKFRPDVLFIHDGAFLSAFEVANCAKKYGIKIIMDSHSDFVNSAKSFVARQFLYRLIYKPCVRRLASLSEIVYATLPLRATFLEQVYGVSHEKIELLPFGIDDASFKDSLSATNRLQIRKALGVRPDDIVIISGGKIDAKKNIHTLAKAFVKLIKSEKISNVKLLIFGRIENSLTPEFFDCTVENSVHLLGWKTPEEVYRLISASDCAIYPGTHSVLWEATIGIGIPCIFQRWQGMEHLDTGGNCDFIDEVNSKNLEDSIEKICLDPDYLLQMKTVAQSEKRILFQYSNIAKTSLKYVDG